jgi:glycosyltransferase involved in cell wall biosynthesis
MNPLVSAIVTTCDRPRLVVEAIRSVLAQTLSDLEVIVVVDGPDAATERALMAIDDHRVRVHVRPTRGGQGAAINSGIALARGEWTAILDDDDVWLPEKLERQLRTAEGSGVPNPVVACRFLARSEKSEVLWPRRSPRADEPVCEYLFCRTSLAFGEGIIPTSMIFARTALFRALPLDEQLRRHCDLDWLTRADHRDDVKVRMPPGDQPLAVWHMQQERSRMSNNHDWRDSFAWLQGARERVSARAYAGFLLTWVSFSACRQRDLGAFAFLVREAFARGRPSAMELAIHTAIWAIPDAVRQRFSRALTTAPSV